MEVLKKTKRASIWIILTRISMSFSEVKEVLEA